jgi:hypothetical protein
LSILLVSSISTIFPLFAQEIHIPDSNFLSALIEQGVDSNNDGVISQDEAENVLSLSISQKGIGDLSGIEFFSNLDSLDCGRNNLKKIDMSKNPTLVYLNCIRNNNLDSIDISNCIELRELLSSDGHLTKVDASDCHRLERLYCVRHELLEIDVSGCDSLTDLEVYRNNLDTLDLSNNLVLDYLACSSNNLNKIDLSNNLFLRGLRSSSNPITELDLSNNSALNTLWIGSMSLSYLDLSNNTSLLNIEIFNNSLSQIDLSNNKMLRTLYCSNNPMETLDISNNTSLVVLSIQDMPDLSEICVWSVPFPPDSFNLYNTGSPNICFKDCVAPEITLIDTFLYQPDIISTVSTENGIIYLVPENTNGELIDIRTATIDSVENVAFAPTVLSLSGLPNGEYWLYARDSTGNISTPKSFSILGVATEQEEKTHFRIYPNPTEDIIIVETRESGSYQIKLSYLNGQTIETDHFVSSNYQLDLSSLENGIYLFSIISESRSETRKVIKF